MTRKLLDHPLSHILLILLPGLLAYANSLNGPFVFDDLESIVNNQTIRNLGNFLPGGPGLDFHLRRWVAYFSFALNYRFGGLAVSGYHATNLAIHLGTALLVYALARLSFRTPQLSGSRLAPQAGLVALLAALVFTLHPVQTQAVTYVVQRLTSLCTLLYLLSLVLYIRGRLDMEGRGTRDQRSGVRVACFAGATVAALLAMFTKEIAFTLPLAAFLYEACFFNGAWRVRLTALLPLLLTLPVIPFLVLRGGELSAAGTLQQTRIDIPRLDYLLTQFPVIVTYLRLLILPAGQNIDYDYPVYTTPFAAPVLLAMLLLLGFLTLGIWLWQKSGSRAADRELHAAPVPELRFVAFGIFWFFLTLSIESGFVPLADVIFEHRLYLPSVGLALGFAAAMALVMRSTRSVLAGRLLLLATAAAIVALGAATWQRNQVWQSEVSLWEDTVRKSPGKVRPLYNYGSGLAEAGRSEEAAQVLAEVVLLDPRHADAWHNLGRAYLQLGLIKEAVPALSTAVSLNRGNDNALLNYTVALIRSGGYREAITLLEERLRRPPELAGFHANLGLAYAGAGNLPAARRELAILQPLDPRLARILADVISRADAKPVAR